MGSESHVGSSRAQQEKEGPQEPDETEGSCWVLSGNRMASRVHTPLGHLRPQTVHVPSVPPYSWRGERMAGANL